MTRYQLLHHAHFTSAIQMSKSIEDRPEDAFSLFALLFHPVVAVADARRVKNGGLG